MEKIIQNMYRFSTFGDLEVQDMDLIELLNFLQLANYFQLEDLFLATEKYMINNLDEICDNGEAAFKGLNFINEKVAFEKLRKTFLRTIQTFFINFEEDTESENGSKQFMELDFQTMKDILMHKDEEDLGALAVVKFNAFKLWFSCNECSYEEKKIILDSFDLDGNEFSPKELLVDVRKAGLYKHVEIFNVKMTSDEMRIKDLKEELAENIQKNKILKEEI